MLLISKVNVNRRSIKHILFAIMLFDIINCVRIKHKSNLLGHDDITSKDNSNNSNNNNKSSILPAMITIFLSGIGDKSFFLTTLFSMKYNKYIVFIASYLSLTIMGIISVEFGQILPKYINIAYIDLFGGLLFLILGFHFLIKTYDTTTNNNTTYALTDESMNDTLLTENESKTNISIFLKCFWLTLISELGDKSQIAMMCLSSNINNIFIFIFIISIVNLMFTSLAIFAGKFIKEYINKKTLEIIIGILFIIFAIIFIKNALSTGIILSHIETLKQFYLTKKHSN